MTKSTIASQIVIKITVIMANCFSTEGHGGNYINFFKYCSVGHLYKGWLQQWKSNEEFGRCPM